MPHTLDKTLYLSALSRFLMLSQNICTNSYRNMVSLTQQEEKPKMLEELTLKSRWFTVRLQGCNWKGGQRMCPKFNKNSLLLIFYLLHKLITFLNLQETSSYKAYWRAVGLSQDFDKKSGKRGRNLRGEGSKKRARNKTKTYNAGKNQSSKVNPGETWSEYHTADLGGTEPSFTLRPVSENVSWQTRGNPSLCLAPPRLSAVSCTRSPALGARHKPGCWATRAKRSRAQSLGHLCGEGYNCSVYRHL